MEAGSESVSLLAMTFLRHLLNVSQLAGFSAFVSDGTRRKTRNLDIPKRLPLLQALLDSIHRRSVAFSYPRYQSGLLALPVPRTTYDSPLSFVGTIIQGCSSSFSPSARLPPANTPFCGATGHEQPSDHAPDLLKVL